MLPRFFAPGLDVTGREVELPEEESRHLARVLRLGPGAAVEVFDGRGREFLGEVASAGRSRVIVRLLSPREPVQAAPVPILVAQAILKLSQMDDVVRDVTMMGAAEIVPLVSAHVVVPGKAIEKGSVADRWRRIALASAKQCRRSILPDVHEPIGYREWLESRRTSDDQLLLMLVEPSAEHRPALTIRSLTTRAAPKSAAILVGPEGGWAAEEVRLALELGALPVTLGRLTLRAEAVALAALAALSVVWTEP